MKKILSIEITEAVTRVVEMDASSKKQKIYNMFEFNTPEGVKTPDGVMFKEEFATVFFNKCEEHNVSTKDVFWVVNETKVVVREAEIPLVKESEILSLINTSISNYFPTEMEGFQIGYQINTLVKRNKKDKNDKTEEKIKLNLIAIPKDIIGMYENISKNLNLSTVGIDYISNGMFNVFSKEGEGKTFAVLKIEDTFSHLSVFTEEQLVFQRVLNYGVGDTARAMAEKYNSTDFVGIIKEKGVLPEKNSFGNEVESDYAKDFQLLTSVVDRSLMFYSSNSNGKNVESIMITGLGASIPGLPELLEKNLKIKIDVMGSTVDGDEEVHVGEYVSCIGAGLRPVFTIAAKKEGKNGKTDETTILKAGIALTILGVAGLGGTFAYSAIVTGALNSRISATEKEILRLQESGIEKLQEDYLLSQTVNNQLNFFQNTTRTRSEELVEFIEWLEDTMPSKAKVTALTADDYGIVLGFEVENKESMAYMIEKFRTYESLQYVSTGGLTDSDSLNHNVGDSVVSFTVTLNYAPLTFDNSEDVEVK